MEYAYCWRVDETLPMLDEQEWDEIAPYLENTVDKIKKYIAEHQCDIATARANCNPEAVEKFFQLTGYQNITYDVIFYLRRSSYGPLCNNCGKLFRMPKAKFCVGCGQTIEENA